MITLTITDPHLMDTAQRAAVLAFFGGHVPAVVSLPKPIPAVIAHEDRPDVGAPLEIPVANAETLGAIVALQPTLDPAKIFGGAAVPLPPSASTPTPPAPPAPIASPPAPAAGLPAGAPLAGAGELDSKGLPWDTRIHASTKGRNADGGWKRRKNTPDEVLQAVEAELRTLMGIPASPPPVPLPAGAVAVATGGTPTTFPELMGWVSKAVAEKKITQADVAAIVQPIGMASVVGLNMRPDLIPQVYASLMARVDELSGG